MVVWAVVTSKKINPVWNNLHSRIYSIKSSEGDGADAEWMQRENNRVYVGKEKKFYRVEAFVFMRDWTLQKWREIIWGKSDKKISKKKCMQKVERRWHERSQRQIGRPKRGRQEKKTFVNSIIRGFVLQLICKSRSPQHDIFWGFFCNLFYSKKAALNHN